MSSNGNERKLSKDEIRRRENFLKVTSELESEGYVKKDLTTSAMTANVAGTGIGALCAAPLMVLFFVLGGSMVIEDSPALFFVTIVAFLVSIVVHELLHGITWSLFARDHFKNIAFGFIVEALTPYCTCKVPLKKGQYIAGLLMPFLILGIIPGIIGAFTGNMYISIFGALSIVGAGGDLLIFSMILRNKENGKVLYLDHPTEVGLVTFVKGA
ncbi:MAG: DUF3267 domain-containing protein [Clostridiales bacterium]|nr:DUF3267 domain-containing protein [Clostridiales bacterium]